MALLIILLPHIIVLSSLFEGAMPLSIYRFIIVGRRPTRFGTHSIKPHSSFNGTTLCKSRIVDNLLKLNLSKMYR